MSPSHKSQEAGVLLEEHLDVGWGTLAATRFGDRSGPRLLCLHGWMDNAASFEPLARCLPEYDWVALDAAGHGASDHRPPPSRYYLTDHLFDIDAVLDQLGWDQCTLISHSMGTGLASCYGCADPARIERVVMFDGLGVATEEATHAGERMARSLQSIRHPRDHRRVFPDPELAARARQIKTPMSDHAARLLSKRAIREDDDGWRWRTDPGAMWTSPYWMTEAQAVDILRGVRCPVLAAVTPYLQRYLGERLHVRLAALEDVTVLKVEGGHHVHMDQPEQFTEALRAFLSDAD